jgi:spore coat polysaccharide biosynthesis predicted glycosyltransferase SpsG
VGHGLNVVLAYDVGPGVGLGHRRRVEALAEAFDRLGVPGELTESRPGLTADIAVVDSYLHHADDPSFVDARYVAALDDLGRDLDVDVVVDPGGTAPPRHRARHVLAGLAFAPLEPGLRHLAAPAVGPVRRILVTTGGADAAAVGDEVAEAIAAADPELDVRLIVGPWSRSSSPPGVTEVRAPNGLARELRDADVVVTAGGVTLLEALCLGRCVVVLETAPNQRGAIRQAVDAGAALQSESDGAAAAVTALVRDDDRRRELATRARALVDGRGASRVAEFILSSTVAAGG